MNTREAAAQLSPALAAAGIADPAFEAELLVRMAAEVTRAAFFASPSLDCAATARLEVALERRLRREPAAYISGAREFYGLAFEVRTGVLIPRPESELLVEIALRELAGTPGAMVMDVGTGSGCIATAIARNAPGARVVATDRSATALAIARRNAGSHDADVAFARCDLAAAIGTADIIVANLPYIPSATIETLEPEVRDWEPRSALDGGHDGLDLICRLIDDCATRLRPSLLALEVGSGQAGRVAAIAIAAGARVEVVRDLAGIERVVCAQWR